VNVAVLPEIATLPPTGVSAANVAFLHAEDPSPSYWSSTVVSQEDKRTTRNDNDDLRRAS
jgi:hypothetical protein